MTPGPKINWHYWVDPAFATEPSKWTSPACRAQARGKVRAALPVSRFASHRISKSSSAFTCAPPTDAPTIRCGGTTRRSTSRFPSSRGIGFARSPLRNTSLIPGEWTRVKIVVDGTTAKLYVHGSAQPTLIVNDLKHGDSQGGVAFWVGPGTDAHFSNLKITAR